MGRWSLFLGIECGLGFLWEGWDVKGDLITDDEGCYLLVTAMEKKGHKTIAVNVLNHN